MRPQNDIELVTHATSPIQRQQPATPVISNRPNRNSGQYLAVMVNQKSNRFHALLMVAMGGIAVTLDQRVTFSGFQVLAHHFGHQRTEANLG